MTSELQNTFLSIVRLGISHIVSDRLESINWDAVEVLNAPLKTYSFSGLEILCKAMNTVTNYTAKQLLKWQLGITHTDSK